ncbi:uncharacterized protein LOC111864836 isoform X2 [Cryptotermes secundus]|uniref:uncharacterized protein LOC111864836 isoform X2 n=1 Tax=Cryptotermes secundus TaxID=105785 RepID=UPI000CD7DA53|nr:uncharacterized protein LOC111864836 isoform X2 [Cryptotermes secundus]
MARVIGDTMELTIPSDNEENLNRLQQQPSGPVLVVLVEGSQDVPSRLTYNGPDTVKQIVLVPVGNSGFNGGIQQAIYAAGSCTAPPSNTSEANLLQREAETNHNVPGGGQEEVPPHWQGNCKNCNVKVAKRLLSVIMIALFTSFATLVVKLIIKGSNVLEKGITEGSGSTNFSGGPDI